MSDTELEQLQTAIKRQWSRVPSKKAVLVGQIEHKEPLPRDVEHVNPHKVMEDPPRGGVLDALAFLVWKHSPVLLERIADAVLKGRIDEQTNGRRINRAMTRSGFLR